MTRRAAITIHAFYPKVLREIVAHLETLDIEEEVFVTHPPEAREEVAAILASSRLPATVLETENLGMDILPFLEAARRFDFAERPYVLKLQTKNPSSEGRAHMRLFLESTIGDQALLDRIRAAFRADPGLAQVGSEFLYLSVDGFIASNRARLGEILEVAHGEARPLRYGYFVGDCFWIAGATLGPLVARLDEWRAMATAEPAWLTTTGGDGAVAHALERAWLEAAPEGPWRIGLTRPDLDGEGSLLRVVDAAGAAAERCRDLAGGAMFARWRTYREDCAAIRRLGAFDADWYRERNGGDIPEGLTPFEHYLIQGEAAGADPGPVFSTTFYREMNATTPRRNTLADFAEASPDAPPRPLTQNDWRRFAEETGVFDEAWYEARYPDAQASGLGGWRHYQTFGARWRRSGSLSFHPRRAGALASDPEAQAAPLDTYVSRYFAEERNQRAAMQRYLLNEEYDRALAIARKMRDDYGETEALAAARALCHLGLGDWDAARRLLVGLAAARSAPFRARRGRENPIPDARRAAATFPTAGERTASPRQAERFCIYNACFDGAEPAAPMNADPGVEMVCLSDAPLAAPGWRVKVIDLPDMDPARAALACMIRPHEFLPDYDASLYVAPDLSVAGRVGAFVAACCAGEAFVAPPHRRFSNMAKKTVAEIAEGLAPVDARLAQLRRYVEAGAPFDIGLPDGDVLWRQHDDTQTRELMDAWWEEVEAGDADPQMALGYLMWARSQPASAPREPCQKRVYFARAPTRPRLAPPAGRPPLRFVESRDADAAARRRNEAIFAALREEAEGREVIRATSIDEGDLFFLTLDAVKAEKRSRLMAARQRGAFMIMDLGDGQPQPAKAESASLIVASSTVATSRAALRFEDAPSILLPDLPEGTEAPATLDAFGCAAADRRDALVVDAKLEELVQFDPTPETLRASALHYCLWSAPDEGLRAFTAGFRAARAGANVVVARGSGEAEHYLGGDYPFLLDRDAGPEEAAEMIGSARDGFGGPDWRYGLDIMAEVAARASPEAFRRAIRTVLGHI